MEDRNLKTSKKKLQMILLLLLVVLVFAAYRCSQATTNLEASLFGMLGGVFLTLLTLGIRYVWELGGE